jgi:hypothetical protein
MSNITLQARQSTPGSDTPPRGDEAWLDNRVRRSESGVFSEVVTLTPALAALLLERNVTNRPISQTAVQNYKRDIMTNVWAVNGQTIVISRDGFLNDGQHRCLAVVEAHRSVRVIMVFGVERDTRYTLDQGRVRTVGHYLTMQGTHNGERLAAVAKYVWQYKTFGFISPLNRLRPTKAELLDFVNRHESGGLLLSDSLIAIRHKKARRLGGESVLGFAHFVFSEHLALQSTFADSPSLAVGPVDEFFSAVLNGSAQPKSAAWMLRSRLEDDAARLPKNIVAELIFRAWVLHRRMGQRPIAKLQLGHADRGLTARLPSLEG